MEAAVRVCPKCRTEYDPPSTRCSFDGSPLLEPEEVEGADTPPFGVPVVSASLGELGPYTLLSIMGEGTMAVVYAAEHKKLGRRCAIKRLRQEHLVDKEMVQRFLAEARTIASIQHPNLVTIYDVVEEPGEAYLVMELLDGRDLETVLLTGPLALERTLRIAAEICDALMPVHARGIVHRDIKPANLFLCILGGQERVKMLDFGAARLLATQPGAAAAEQRLQRDRSTLGSPLYMSPEQVSGDALDARSDLYSLGVVMYQMVTGQPPFNGETFSDVMLQHVHHEARPPSALGVHVPPGLEAAIMRCLAKDPGERFRSAGELAGELRNIANGLGFEIAGSSPSLPRTYAAPPARARSPWPVLAAAGLLLVGSAGLVMALRRGTPPTLAAANDPPPRVAPIALPVTPVPVPGILPPVPTPPSAIGRTVHVETTPTGSTVDPAGGGASCTSPCSLQLAAGAQTINFHKPGYRDQQVTVGPAETVVRVDLARLGRVRSGEGRKVGPHGGRGRHNGAADPGGSQNIGAAETLDPFGTPK